MTAKSAYLTHTGLNAKYNEDYVWVNDNIGLYIIADGMGGHEAGDVASKLAATTVGETVSADLAGGLNISSRALKDVLINSIEIANTAVWEASGEAGQARRMGATIVVGLLNFPTLYIAHAGDARAYLIRKTEIKRLTEDDSWVAHLVSHGLLSEADGKDNKLGHVITKAIGQDGPVGPSVIEVPLEPGDWVLLCSDGLWNMVSDEQILAEVQSVTNKPEKLVEKLIEAANAAGGKDNISVAAIRIE